MGPLLHVGLEGSFGGLLFRFFLGYSARPVKQQSIIASSIGMKGNEYLQR